MDKDTKRKMAARAAVIKAIAHPTRLFIVEQLSAKPRSVGELTGKIGADMSTVSRHLAVLKHVGIVKDERKGSVIRYSLRCPCIMKFFSCAESVLVEANGNGK
jgi:ArsR family transcriptional regulator